MRTMGCTSRNRLRPQAREGVTMSDQEQEQQLEKREPAERCGVNRDGLRQLGRAGKASPAFRQLVITVGIVALVLMLAIVFELAKFPAPVIGVIVLVAAVVLALLAVNPHVVRTRAGKGWVYTRLVRRQPVRVMRVGGVYQSATYLGLQCCEPVFGYIKAFDAVFEAEDAVRTATGHGVERVLSLGGGGFSWPKHAVYDHDDLHVDAVEIDPAVIQAARRWFYLDMIERYAGNRLRVRERDGRAVLDKLAARLEAGEPRARRYDAIVNDTFTGSEPVRELVTVEAARAAHACLNPGGVYAVNVVSSAEGSDVRALRNQVATLSQVFAHVHVLSAEDEVWGGETNYLVLATDGATTFEGAIPYDDDFLGTVQRD